MAEREEKSSPFCFTNQASSKSWSQTLAELYELKYREKLQLVVEAGFQSGATEVITSEKNYSAILSSLSR